MLMDPDDRAVDHAVFEVGVLGQLVEKTLPYTLPSPPPEARVNAVPLAELIGQIAPRRPGAHDPQDRLHKQAIVLSTPTRVAHLARQFRCHPCPLLVAQDFSNQGSSPPICSLESRFDAKVKREM
jgi:hypothetical protein